jgi:hypothetical protein
MKRKQDLMHAVQRSIDVLADALSAARVAGSALGKLGEGWTESVRQLSGLDDDVLFIRGLTLAEIECEVVRHSLRRNRGKRAAVVNELQIAKSTLMKWIAQWGLQDEGRDDGAPRGNWRRAGTPPRHARGRSPRRRGHAACEGSRRTPASRAGVDGSSLSAWRSPRTSTSPPLSSPRRPGGRRPS